MTVTSSWRTRLSAVQRLLRLSLAFIVPLVVVLGVLGVLSMQVSGPLLQGWTQRELDERAGLVSKALHGAIMLSLEEGNQSELTQQIESLTEDERLYAIAVCTSPNAVLAASRNYPSELACAEGRDATTRVGPAMARWLSQMHVRRIDLPVAPAAGGGLVSDAAPDGGHVTLVRRELATVQRHVQCVSSGVTSARARCGRGCPARSAKGQSAARRRHRGRSDR